MASKASKFASPKVNATIAGGTALGKMCLKRISLSVSPSAFPASTYCNPFTFKISPLISLVMLVHEVKPIMSTRIPKDGLTKAASARIKIKRGTEEKSSVSFRTPSSTGKFIFRNACFRFSRNLLETKAKKKNTAAVRMLMTNCTKPLQPPCQKRR